MIAASQPISAASLGALVGLASLRLLPRVPPPATWGDEAAPRRRLVSNVAVVGIDRSTLDLAMACARSGDRLLILLPDDGVPDDGVLGWLAVLGAQVLRVSASTADTHAVAPVALAASGYTLADPADAFASSACTSPPAVPCESPSEMPSWMLAEALATARAAGELLVVGGDTLLRSMVDECVADGRSETLALPFPGRSTTGLRQVVAVVGVAAADRPALTAVPGPGPLDSEWCPAAVERDDVLSVAVSRREVRAMQRLLARETGLIVSEQGALGGAALMRALVDDRSRRLGERRLRSVRSALVVVPGPLNAPTVGPPLAHDGVPQVAVTLAELLGSGARCIVAPPRPGAAPPVT